MSEPQTTPQYPSPPERSPPWPTPPRRFPAPAPRRRPFLHLGLMAATAFTLAIAGGTFWASRWPAVAELLKPQVLASVLREGATYAGWVLLTLAAHEMGHYLACRRHGIAASPPFFLPGIPPLGSFGALIRIRGPIPGRRALFDVAAAGPLAGFAVALPLLVAGVLGAEPIDPVPDELAGGVTFGSPVVVTILRALLGRTGPIEMNALLAAGWVGALVTSLNLFPVGQLDGGHATYALSRRLHRALTWATLVALGILVAVQLSSLRQIPAYLLWLVILGWMRDRHPRLVDETTSLGARRTLVACLLLAIFVACFVPLPIFIR